MLTYTVDTLAQMLGAEIQGDPACVISGVASLKTAQPGQLSFALNKRYQQLLKQTKASVVVITKNDVADCPTNALIVTNPELAFAKVAVLYEHREQLSPGIHPSAIIGDGCKIDPSASIGARCVLGNKVVVGAHTVIKAGSVLGSDCHIGTHCMIYANVTLYEAVEVGNRVIVHSGVVLGSDGFGLAQDQGRWVKIPQLGRVIIKDDVEIGANTTVDRGALDDTVIGTGVKLDNQIQIAHNVHIGDHTVIAGAAAVAGSAKIGNHCMIGGAACINGHITIADRVIITGMAMVTHSLTKPGIYSSGTSIQTNKAWLRSVRRFHQLDDLAKKIKKLERQDDD